jgi:NAD(P)-dependent dehydrogenase (short-subunit alcohol dehydrogenase family)
LFGRYAAVAFASVLRMELQDWGIRVCTVLPSFHLTPLITDGVAKVEQTWWKA